MTALAKSLAAYRDYHRDHRNVLTHALGIPMIVLAITTLLARPEFMVPLLGVAASPAIIAAALAGVWYLRLDFGTGLLMAVLLALFLSLGKAIAAISTEAWLGGGIGLFVVGWIFQLVGHRYEGRKPAFIDDVRSLLVGPLFVVVEGLFALGLMKGLRAQVDG